MAGTFSVAPMAREVKNSLQKMLRASLVTPDPLPSSISPLSSMNTTSSWHLKLSSSQKAPIISLSTLFRWTATSFTNVLSPVGLNPIGISGASLMFQLSVGKKKQCKAETSATPTTKTNVELSTLDHLILSGKHHMLHCTITHHASLYSRVTDSVMAHFL